jgi:putative hydrolase of the HAD superfamily
MDLLDYIQKNNKTHIIFDFDATLFLLILPWANWYEGLKAELRKYDTRIWDEYESKMISQAEMQNKYMQNHGEAVRSFMNEHSRAFESEQLVRHEPNTDLLEVLKQLQDKELFIWSSNTFDTIQRVLSETNMLHYFENIITRDKVQFIKPQPDGFLLIRKPDISTDRYLMVGDSSHDRGAAEAAGIDFYLTDFFNIGA